MRKNLKKALLSLVAVFALAMAVQTSADAAENVVKQVGCADDQVTLSWEKPTLSGATLTGYYVYDNLTGKYLLTSVSADATSVAVPVSDGKGYSATWTVGYIYTSESGGGISVMDNDIGVNTTPVDCDDDIELSYVSSKRVCFANYNIGICVAPEGFQTEIYQLSDGKKKKTLKVSVGGSGKCFKYKADTAYKYRTRYYCKNRSNGETYYGNWSKYYYFAIPSSYNELGLEGTLKKGSGIVKYKIQVSTKENSGYKTVKTIKIGKKSKYSYQITKYKGKKLKENKIYYVRVIPILKGNKTSTVYIQEGCSFTYA